MTYSQLRADINSELAAYDKQNHWWCCNAGLHSNYRIMHQQEVYVDIHQVANWQFN